MKNLLLLACLVIFSTQVAAADSARDTKNSKLKFNKLHLKANTNLQIHLEDAASINLGDNQNSITAQTSRGVLTLSSGSRPSSEDSDIDVCVKKLDSIVHDGAGDIEFDDVDQKSLEIVLNGAGDIRISGHVERLVATLNGSGDLDLEDLDADYATVKVSGAGTASISVNRELNAEISGAGDIRYQGDPVIKSKKITGAGSLAKMTDDADQDDSDDADENDESEK